MSTLFEKRHLSHLLSINGFRVEGEKILASDAYRILGATFKDPEWLPLADYPIELAYPYINMIQDDEKSLGRTLLPMSFYLACYRGYLDEMGNSIQLDGLVYHYSLSSNPRNVHYAYRLYVDGECLKKGSDLPSMQSAKAKCDQQAKEFILSFLYDMKMAGDM
jgi:hypothetical protein